MNDFREYSNYLMHYGVKGMKWDHHKAKDDDNKDDNNKKQYTGDPTIDMYLNYFAKEGERYEEGFNEADKAGEAINEMLEKGNYTGALGYYQNLDPETKGIVDEYIKNNYIAEALGNGDTKLGRQRVKTGEQLVKDFQAAWSKNPAQAWREAISNMLPQKETHQSRGSIHDRGRLRDSR